MRILEAAAVLCEEVKKSPALRIVFAFKDGSRILVGKSSGADPDAQPLRVCPDEGAPEIIEVEGFACDQVGNLLPDAKKVQRFFLEELIAGFDLIEADPGTLDRVREALSGEGGPSPAARQAARREPAKGGADAKPPPPRHLRMADDGPLQK